MGGHDRAVQRAEELDVGDVQVPRRDVLHEETARETAEIEPAERLREVHSDEAEGAHFLDQLGLDARLDLALPVAGGKPLLGETARGVAHGGVFFAESEIHGVTPESSLGGRQVNQVRCGRRRAS